ncbi:MAG: enolase C-terminal domain-like protein [Betaproteobacteria bacterium]
MSNRLTIRSLRARPVLVPMRIPPVAATGSIPNAPLVLVDLETDQGITGRCYLFAVTAIALKPVVEALNGVATLIKGDPVAPVDIDAKLKRRLTLLDTPGVYGLALAGIDMCAWDALAQAQGVPLVALLGGAVRPVKAYNSCGLWVGEVAQLADQASRLVDEGKFSAVKMRLGRPDFAQDLAAVRAVKARIGEGITLMCDFNQSLTWSEGIRRGRALDYEGLYWIEEPVRHGDYAGSARIAAAVDTPIQIGENLLTSYELTNAIGAGAMDFVMPDVQRIGGVTGWMRAAAIAHAHGMEMSSHLFPEFSSHLLAVTPTCHWLEYVDWAAPILEQPVELRDGHVVISDRPGAGIGWNESAVAKYLAG